MTRETTTTRCPFELPDGEQCGDEIEIEWEITFVNQPTGWSVCRHCGANNAPNNATPDNCTEFNGHAHDWEPEDDLMPHQEVYSYKTYCFHPLTKEQAGELLDDLAVAYEEQRMERMWEGR